MTQKVLTVFIVSGLAISSAYAQQIEAPPRASGITRGERPLDVQRNRQEVTVQANVLAGYDDDVSPDGSTAPVGPRPSGYTGAGSGRLRYFVGRDRKSLEVNTRGLVNSYDTIGTSYGGGVDAIGQTHIGRTDITTLQGIHSSPFFALGLFGALHDELGAENPDTNPSNGITESRMLSIDSIARVNRQWTRDFSTDVGFAFNKQTFSRGNSFDSRTNGASLGVQRAFDRDNSIRASYRYSDGVHTEATGRELPETDQTIDLGWEHHRNVTRARQVVISVGAGAVYVDTLNSETRAPFTYWTPSGRGSLQYDLGGTWSVAGEYRRGLSVLNGVIPTSFISHTASLRTGGRLGDRVETAYVLGYGNGQAGDNDSTSYDGYTGTAQVRVRLFSGLSWISNINRYQYQLSEGASAILGVQRRLHRNAFWTGFTWSAPLYRRYMRGSTR